MLLLLYNNSFLICQLATVPFNQISSLENFFPFSSYFKELTSEKNYYIEGLVQKASFHILSTMEENHFCKSTFPHATSLIQSEVTPDFYRILKSYLNKITSYFTLSPGPFRIKITLTKKGGVLKNIILGAAPQHMAHLIGYSTKIDYYDYVLKTLTGYPLPPFISSEVYTGLLFFSDDVLMKKNLKIILKNPFVKEVKMAHEPTKDFCPNALNQSLSHNYAILLHEDQKVLKKQMKILHSLIQKSGS